jgi:hypothetical protein
MVTAKKSPAPKAAPVRAAKTAVKTAAKTTVKAALKPASKAPVKKAAKPRAAKKVVAKKVTAPAPSTAPKATETKVKKPKLVRDSFTMPKAEYAVIDELKQRAAKLGHPVKKSELLRAAIKVIAGLSDAAFIAAMSAVPPIKTGRPSKS